MKTIRFIYQIFRYFVSFLGATILIIVAIAFLFYQTDKNIREKTKYIWQEVATLFNIEKTKDTTKKVEVGNITPLAPTAKQTTNLMASQILTTKQSRQTITTASKIPVESNIKSQSTAPQTLSLKEFNNFSDKLKLLSNLDDDSIADIMINLNDNEIVHYLSNFNKQRAADIIQILFEKLKASSKKEDKEKLVNLQRRIFSLENAGK